MMRADLRAPYSKAICASTHNMSALHEELLPPMEHPYAAHNYRSTVTLHVSCAVRA